MSGQEPVSIRYQGVSAAESTARLEQLLSKAGVSIAPRTDDTSRDGELGPAEIIMTIAATALAKAAARVLLTEMRVFLHERIEALDQNLRVRVVIKVDGQPNRPMPFSLAKATLQTADAFCHELGKLLDK